MLRRRFALLALSLIAATAIVGIACSDEDEAPPLVPDAAPSSEAAPGICPDPDAAPRPGDTCILPEGTTCAFGACGTPIAECRGGFWLYGGNPPPQPACPDPAPPVDTPCPPCWSPSVSCTYGTCVGAEPSARTTVASCPSGTWSLVAISCLDADGEPIIDASTDVQGDAEPNDD